MRTPGATLKEHQSPKNDLTDVAGLKQLVATPRVRRAQVGGLGSLALLHSCSRAISISCHLDLLLL